MAKTQNFKNHQEGATTAADYVKLHCVIQENSHNYKCITYAS